MVTAGISFFSLLLLLGRPQFQNGFPTVYCHHLLLLCPAVTSVCVMQVVFIPALHQPFMGLFIGTKLAHMYLSVEVAFRGATEAKLNWRLICTSVYKKGLFHFNLLQISRSTPKASLTLLNGGRSFFNLGPSLPFPGLFSVAKTGFHCPAERTAVTDLFSHSGYIDKT